MDYNLGITSWFNSSRRNTYACQIEPNARHCQFPGPSLTNPLILCFPKQRVNVVTRLVSCQISPASIASTVDDPIGVTELLTNWCYISHRAIAHDSAADIELVEESMQPTIDATWSHGLAEWQVKLFSIEWRKLSRPFPAWNHHVIAWLDRLLRYCSVGNRFDTDIFHEEVLPSMLENDLYQMKTQHQSIGIWAKWKTLMRTRFGADQINNCQAWVYSGRGVLSNQWTSALVQSTIPGSQVNQYQQLSRGLEQQALAFLALG